MSVTPLRRKDATANERQRRSRHRKKQAAVNVVTRDSIVPAVTLLAALTLAAVSAGFSIIGLTSIFAGAFWPIIAMGCAFEFGKVAAVTWLGRRYAVPRPVKAVLVALVITLMMLNAVGAYGFLAHAHLKSVTRVSSVFGARAADVDAKREVQAAVVSDIDKRIAQIDGAVNETIRRGRTTAAMALVAQEAAHRKDLIAERINAANTLAGLQVEAAQVDGDRVTNAADSGPVRYLAALIGADEETAMRWFILLVAVLLDPLAIVLLLAATAACDSSKVPVAAVRVDGEKAPHRARNGAPARVSDTAAITLAGTTHDR